MPRTQFTGIGINIKAKDINASREFYEGLGFVPVFGYGDPDFIATLPQGAGSAPEKYRGVTYRLTDHAELEVAEGHVAVKPEVFKQEITGPKISAMIRVKSVVPVIEHIGADNISFPVRKYYWGSVEVALKDPDGFVLIFISEATDEEMAAVRKLTELEIVDPS